MSINEKQDSVSVVTPVLLYDVLRLCCLKNLYRQIQFYLFTFLLFYLYLKFAGSLRHSCSSSTSLSAM